MYTYQMIGLADENGKTYECKYGTYNKEDKFKFNEEAGKVFKNHGYAYLFDVLVHEDLWKLKTGKKMTLKDIEKELGYEIQLVDDEEDNPKYHSIDDVFDYLFGRKY